jgi:hypothetical protein
MSHSIPSRKHVILDLVHRSRLARITSCRKHIHDVLMHTHIKYYISTAALSRNWDAFRERITNRETLPFAVD